WIVRHYPEPLTPAFSAGEAYDVVPFIPTLVYVDSHWAGQGGPLVVPDPVGNLSFGVTAFADIQTAINHVAFGGTVVISGGSYPAAINISKPLGHIETSVNPLVAGATTVTIGGAVTLGANTTFVMRGANLTLGSTIDATTAGAASLTVNGTMTN